MKKIVLLGASGSIGKSTIEILKKHKDQFELIAFSVYTQTNLIESLLNEFKSLKAISVKSKEDIAFLIKKYPHVSFYDEKEDGLLKLCELKSDLVVNALVGFAGLLPTLKAIENKIDIALANKETLVSAGELVMKKAKENNVKIYPVDSEHSAIFQCLEKENEVSKIILTASGGPFYKKSKEEVYNAKLTESLNHPNWKMGNKISIDSATMFNKAFEIIEAYWLFNLKKEQIEVVIHPQSIVHSMVEFKDKSIKAQLGVADMKIPIAYALSYPKRIDDVSLNLDVFNLHLDFYPVDLNRFRAISLAYEVLDKKGAYPTVLNAANEEAVRRYLNSEISFGDIEEIVIKTLHDYQPVDKELDLQDIIFAHNWAVSYARRLNI